LVAGAAGDGNAVVAAVAEALGDDPCSSVPVAVGGMAGGDNSDSALAAAAPLPPS